jgi:anthraniloyl-CoA monooxygenase
VARAAFASGYDRAGMKIVSVGGGPGGLYFAILMKKAFPAADISVLERNQAGDTFGWGVVFSDETLGHFEQADPESYAEIRKQFAYWGDIETYFGGACVRSTGHGFCGLSRKRLLEIFHARCRELGVRLEFQREVKRFEEVAGADLVLAADGLNSVLRTEFEDQFQPVIRWGRARFCWLGTDRHLDAFTFVFKENEHGLFQVHAYPFEPELSTWIVECQEDTWRRAGLDKASEQQTVAYCERLFAPDLKGHRLLTNRSIWRSFPTVTNARWHHRNLVLIGDAAHTAHFSIGSGTKLAMEDAIALVDAFRAHGTADVCRVLAAYEESRRVDVAKTQKSAQTSLEWFENSARYMRQHPLQFSFNLLTRSKRITWENLRVRDPALVDQVDRWFADEARRYAPAAAAPSAPSGPLALPDEPAAPPPGAPAPPPMFAPFRLRELQLGNRVVVSPMCQYSARDGVPGDWHLVHLGSRAVGGAGLVITEMTDVMPEGRITYGCTGMWSDAQEHAWRRIVDFVHGNSAARIGMQLAHAGRKGSTLLPWEGGQPLRDASAWTTLAPSALPFAPGWPAPRAMDRRDMDAVRDAFVAAVRRADRAGFDLVELHMAHGYLLSSFISPASNRRTDNYGGTLQNRMRFPLEVFDAVRAAWPGHKPLSVRISATDWLDDGDGLTAADSVEVARLLHAHGLDLVDVSSGGNTPDSKPVYGRMYQVPFADRIRHEVGMPVMAVGAILGPDHVNTVIAAGRADLCALARPHLVDPYLTLRAAVAYGQATRQPWPNQYLPARPTPPAPPAPPARG